MSKKGGDDYNLTVNDGVDEGFVGEYRTATEFFPDGYY